MLGVLQHPCQITTSYIASLMREGDVEGDGKRRGSESLFGTCLDERDQHPLASAGSVIEKYYRKVLAGQIFKKLKD